MRSPYISNDISGSWVDLTVVDGEIRELRKKDMMPNRVKSLSKSTLGTSVLPKSSTCCSFHVILLLNTHDLHCRLLLGNPAKAERILGWKRKVDFESLVKEMVEADLKAAASLVEDQN